MIVHDFVTTPAVVVGGGIAGLSTALALDSCVVVANEPIGGGSSSYAQGGVAAAIGFGDSPGLHAADTLKVAVGLALPEIAALVAGSAPDRIDWLAANGVAFDRQPSGALALGREAGHGRHRIVHAGGDRTGAAIMRSLCAAVLKRPGIRVLEPFDLIDLVTVGDRAAGVLLAGADGRRLAVLAPNVVLATGGIGTCFDRTTNPGTSSGAGLAAAARRGVMLADLEFVQFHPTALAIDADPLPLLTEALRGAGAKLLDESGERFMQSIHPDAELAPRDIVARSVHALRASGRQVFLDTTAVPELEARFPGACKIARAAGFEPHRQPLPVATAAHFHMGGIATDENGACTMTGLWACGEVSSTGLHGANRLASNSLLEGLVFGERIARDIRRVQLTSPRGALEVASRPANSPGDGRIPALRQLVGASLGPLRTGPAMVEALRRLETWGPATHAEDDRIVVARELLSAALERRESRGAHQRADFPESATGMAARSFRRPQPAQVESLELVRSHVA
jgi:L-aspartate oxidase